MKDRIPTPGQEGRVLITPEGAGAPYYAVVRQADNPIEPGTALNKANLLSDSTVVALRLDPADNPTPNDAFNKLSRSLSGYVEEITLPAAGWQPVDAAMLAEYPEFADYSGLYVNFWPPLNEAPLSQITVLTSADAKIVFRDAARGLKQPVDGMTVEGRTAFFMVFAQNEATTLTVKFTDGFADGGLV